MFIIQDNVKCHTLFMSKNLEVKQKGKKNIKEKVLELLQANDDVQETSEKLTLLFLVDLVPFSFGTLKRLQCDGFHGQDVPR